MYDASDPFYMVMQKYNMKRGNTMIKAGIIGATGYAGAELVRILIVYAVTFNFYRIWHVIPAALFSLVIGFVFACLSNKPEKQPEPVFIKERVQESGRRT